MTVTSFTVAVNRRFGGKNGEEAQTDFFTVTAWRQTAEFITRYFRKASSICIVGSLRNRSWTDRDGQKRVATEIVADEAYFVDARDESPINANASDTQPAYIPEQYTQGAAPTLEEIDGEELPF